MHLLTTVLTLAALLAQVLAAEDPINTPAPMQAPQIPNCLQFSQAVTGETCDSLAAKAQTPVSTILSLNPALASASQCNANIIAGYWYCMMEKPDQTNWHQAPPPPYEQKPADPKKPAPPPAPEPDDGDKDDPPSQDPNIPSRCKFRLAWLC